MLPFQPADPVSVRIFAVIVTSVLIATGLALRQAKHPRWMNGIAVWLILSSLAISMGLLEKLPMHGLPFFF